jgi:peptidoglycan-associated lipoprotein
MATAPVRHTTCGTLVVLALAAATATGCNHFVQRDEFDAAMGELRATDARLEAQLQDLGRDLQSLADKYEASIRRIDQGNGTSNGIRIDTTATYFDTGKASLSSRAKALLDDFARAVNNSHGNAMITVEGFADPSGPAAFNQRLGQRRADAARDYLVKHAGLHPMQVQAVSYGEAENRQVRPGATGPEGRDNRRIALVVDYPGPQVRISSN